MVCTSLFSFSASDSAQIKLVEMPGDFLDLHSEFFMLLYEETAHHNFLLPASPDHQYLTGHMAT
jgi:hypothetical protein